MHSYIQLIFCNLVTEFTLILYFWPNPDLNPGLLSCSARNFHVMEQRVISRAHRSVQIEGKSRANRVLLGALNSCLCSNLCILSSYFMQSSEDNRRLTSSSPTLKCQLFGVRPYGFVTVGIPTGQTQPRKTLNIPLYPCVHRTAYVGCCDTPNKLAVSRMYILCKLYIWLSHGGYLISVVGVRSNSGCQIQFRASRRLIPTPYRLMASTNFWQNRPPLQE